MFSLAKHHIRNSIILTTLGTFLIVMIIGLSVRVSERDLLIMALLAIGIGAIAGGLIGWVFQRLIFSILGSKIADSKPHIDVQAITDNVVTIKYELNSYDMLSIYLYNYEHCPGLGKSRKLMRRMLLSAIALELVVAVILPVILGRAYLPFTAILVALAALSILYYSLSPLVIRKSLRRAVVRNYGQGKDKLTGKHKLSITADAVTDIAEMGESKTKWSAIDWIDVTGQYLYITVRGSGPYIIPRRAFTDEAAFKHFVDTVRTCHQTAIASKDNPSNPHRPQL